MVREGVGGGEEGKGGRSVVKYIYNIYTPNLGLRVAVFDREREQ